MYGPGLDWAGCVGTDPGMEVGHGLGGLLMLQDVDGWYGERRPNSPAQHDPKRVGPSASLMTSTN
jgi:hypothetical protein